MIQTETPTLQERIRQRRLQILVHSCIYYEFGRNIVDDHIWNRWAHELVQLQLDNPEAAGECIYADAFKDFDGSTGFHLPFRDADIVAKAERLLHFADGLTPEEAPRAKQPPKKPNMDKRRRLF